VIFDPGVTVGLVVSYVLVYDGSRLDIGILAMERCRTVILLGCSSNQEIMSILCVTCEFHVRS
jgi:hypothetical protein